MQRSLDRRGLLLSLAAVTALTLVPGSADARTWRRTPPAVSVAVVDGMGGALQTFMHNGQTFVMGGMGQRYAVRISNNTSERLEVVMAVDGRDAVRGKRSNMMSDRGYVLSPMGSVTVEGFRTSMDAVAAFRFSDPSESFAGQMGDSRMSIGIIQVAVFKERMMDDEIAGGMDDGMRHKAPGRGRASAGAKARPRTASPGASASGRARRMAPESRDQSQLGTEFGEERMSRVTRVSFERAGGAAQIVTLRYDNAAGLEARGIQVRPMMRNPRRPMRPTMSRR